MAAVRRDFAAIADRIRSEGPITLSAAAKLVPSHGRRGHASVSSLSRWAIHGKQGVFLEAFRTSGEGWMTSAQAVSRFLAALTEQVVSAKGDERSREVPGLQSPTAQSREQREVARRADAAKEQLRAMGVKC